MKFGNCEKKKSILINITSWQLSPHDSQIFPCRRDDRCLRARKCKQSWAETKVGVSNVDVSANTFTWTKMSTRQVIHIIFMPGCWRGRWWRYKRHPQKLKFYTAAFVETKTICFRSQIWASQAKIVATKPATLTSTWGHASLIKLLSQIQTYSQSHKTWVHVFRNSSWNF